MALLVREFPDFLATEPDPIAADIACGRGLPVVYTQERRRERVSRFSFLTTQKRGANSNHGVR